MAGFACRYNGVAKPVEHISALVQEGQAIAVCPELLAGFSTPRRPAEIVGGTGEDVLDGKARIVDDSGDDVTEQFVAGAQRVLELVKTVGAHEAILKEGSPSCGSGYIYDGTFSGNQQPGNGVTTALLRRHGITIHSEKTWPPAE
ncbi:DUF523 domain-containing protein [Ktedonosporobacter rubrisoli]|uniref:DUF523 domain-containing protein n=1 Tax=Ktedonosporobacter rubrisoli TaxID=2509675 RepID=A0A4P6K5D1_KTERU|nr:DUF523 domain-containing protein [Ktedonosporobacter rubrisoli]